jgi:hypothetical protein
LSSVATSTAVDLSDEPNIHEHEVGTMGRRLIEGFIGGSGRRTDDVAKLLHGLADVSADDPLILDDEQSFGLGSIAGGRRDIHHFPLGLVTSLSPR